MRLGALGWRFMRALRRVRRDPDGKSYIDLATTPACSEDLEELEIFSASGSARAEVEKVRAKEEQRLARLVSA